MTPEDAILLAKVRRALDDFRPSIVQVGSLRMSRATARMIERNLTAKPERVPHRAKAGGGGDLSPWVNPAAIPFSSRAVAAGGAGDFAGGGSTSSSASLGDFPNLSHASFDEPKGQHDHVRHSR